MAGSRLRQYAHLLAFSLLLLADCGQVSSQPGPQQLLVQLRGPAGGGKLAAASLPPGVSLQRQVAPGSRIWRAEAPEEQGLEGVLSALRAHPSVEYAEPDFERSMALAPNDPAYATDQNYLRTIDAPAAWEVTTGDAEVAVCVLDSGIARRHPDLAPNIPRDAGLDLSAGFSDTDAGWWLENRQDPDWADKFDHDPADSLGHGTHIAGIVAAAGNNSVGGSGVAWRAKLVTCKVMNWKGGARVSAVLACLAYCRARNATIVQASWAGPDMSRFELQELLVSMRAGAVVVAAAGNLGADLDKTPAYPAAWTSQLDGVISVGASAPAGGLADFSGYGRRSVDLTAPGVHIYSTFVQPVGEFAFMSGTSVAAPQVSGAATLMLAATGGAASPLSGADIKRILLATVDRIPALAGKTVSGGRLNVGRAVYRAMGRCYPRDPACSPAAAKKPDAAAKPAPRPSPKAEDSTGGSGTDSGALAVANAARKALQPKAAARKSPPLESPPPPPPRRVVPRRKKEAQPQPKRIPARRPRPPPPAVKRVPRRKPKQG